MEISQESFSNMYMEVWTELNKSGKNFTTDVQILLSTASHTYKIYLKCKANSDYFAPSYQTTVECEWPVNTENVKSLAN